ncbi:hypothetical protein J4481_01010 [Candidatus Pacearchaeota archaeon]|nr:hypothetical protein [Candidatus Pacearchaeota archaeon]
MQNLIDKATANRIQFAQEKLRQYEPHSKLLQMVEVDKEVITIKDTTQWSPTEYVQLYEATLEIWTKRY